MSRTWANNAITSIVGNISDTATLINVVDGTVFTPVPTPTNEMTAVIEQGTSWEVVHITNVVGNQLTIVRGREGTTATSFLDGAQIANVVTKAVMDEVETAIAGGSTRPVIVGSVAGFYFRGNASDISASIGAANQTSNGTLVGRAYSASVFGQQTRGGWNSVAAINSSAGRTIPFGSSAALAAHNEALRYNATLGASDTAFQSTASIFAGARFNAGIPTDPALLTTSPFICFGNSPGDTTMAIFHSSGGGSVTKIDLGANFPHNASNIDWYLVEFYRAPATNTWQYYIRNATNGAVAQGTLNTNIPALSAAPSWHTNRSTVAGTTAISLDVGYVLVESGWVR
jgi:hypothetical protein